MYLPRTVVLRTVVLGRSISCTPKFIIGKNCSMGHIGCVWDYGSGDEGGEILEGDE